jgi:ABC-2 type transport system ATP-binding protein
LFVVPNKDLGTLRAMTIAIRTEHLSKIFRVGFWARKVRAVEDVSLEVKSGEIFGLLGPNGAGKTTTIKMLVGFVRPSRGVATVAGEPAGSLAARRRLGYLPENPALYEFLTGVEYLRFAGRLAGLTRRDSVAQADRLIDQVGLAGRADRAIRRFSKGMVQRLGLAQALIGDPELVVLDEPMSGLDPIGRKDVRDIIFRLRAEGRTVLFSTHILSDVEAICDRVGIMIAARLTDCGTLSSLLDPGVRAVEIVARGLPPGLQESLVNHGAQAMQRDGAWVLTFPAEGPAQQAIRAIVGAGGTLVSVAPHRETLESLFVQRAQASATPAS